MLPHDATFLTATPHMHEYGTVITSQFGPTDALDTVIDVSTWTADMRDAPEIIDFESGAAPSAGQYAGGDVIRTRCEWSNPTGEAIGFPAEMCATTGYFYSSDPEAAPIFCTGL